MSRRSDEPVLGSGFSQRTLLIFSVALLGPVLIAVVVGIWEPALFTTIARQYNYELNYAIIADHWSLLCVLMAINFAVPVVCAFLISYIQYGWTPRTQIITAGGLIGFALAVFIEDFIAHLRYGALPADDWSHWIFPAIVQVKTNFWIPIWYFIIILLVVGSIVWFGWFYLTDLRGGGRIR